MERSHAPLVAIAFALAACGNSQTDPTTSAATDGGSGLLDGSGWDDPDVTLPEDDPDTITVRAPIEPIASGTEVERTLRGALGNDVPRWVQSIAWTSPKGLHHARFDTPPDATFHTYPVLTLPVGANEAIQTFPPGYALPIAANQPIQVSYHYVNATREVLEGEIVVKLHALPPDAPPPKPVSMLWLMNEAIDLPPKTKVDLETTCAVPMDVSLHSIVPHTHGLGRGVEVFFASGARAGERIYESLSSTDGPAATFDPPIALASGESLRFVCHYDNTTDHHVTFGDLSTDEMCGIAGYYTTGSAPIALVVETPGGPCVQRDGR